MATCVLDASAVLSYMLGDGRDEVDAFFESSPVEDDWLGPMLLFGECTSVIYENGGDGNLSLEEVSAQIADLFAIGIEVTGHPTQIERAVQLAREFGHARLTT
jgi:hypothetical protein